ncbi:hypothetical protein TIFTF001_056098 [Ficus carica]|uniref:Uncharacterized protein n=1 Tax=Ficus carica TaxID=3494 RepID=A0AA88EMZ0_FICCA|nr:hypothetical protein TIFTF001_056098 [Ficus carica]
MGNLRVGEYFHGCPSRPSMLS